jgi:hypothetical protein
VAARTASNGFKFKNLLCAIKAPGKFGPCPTRQPMRFHVVDAQVRGKHIATKVEFTGHAYAN